MSQVDLVEIDGSNILELTEQQLKQARRVGRPRTGNAKQLIALRVAPALLAKLRKMAKKQGVPYQTLMHELLERGAERG